MTAASPVLERVSIRLFPGIGRLGGVQAGHAGAVDRTALWVLLSVMSDGEYMVGGREPRDVPAPVAGRRAASAAREPDATTDGPVNPMLAIRPATASAERAAGRLRLARPGAGDENMEGTP
jgi:hypothetical protein